ncbi:hypothetical protein GCM10009808_10980 [Microbacterium sediminicola]|uniref:Histidine kinase/HSP90-like ATPase domain-containing protein n=1 Tax=Microbacterium sediminicola TaxID=415210 RepID=A0ABN2HYH0_9MICO
MPESSVRTSLTGVAEAGLIDEVHSKLAWLWANVEGATIDDRELFELAVGEVAANVVEHGRGRPPVEITVTLEASSTALTAIFADNADPAVVDLSGVSMPDVDAESGRGLALALLALDELVHETGPGNTWRLVRHLGVDRG